MDKNFDQLGFKDGDVVKCLSHRHHIYTVGEVYTLSKYELTDALVILGRYNGKMGNWELVKSAEEDKPMTKSKWTTTKTEVVTKETKSVNETVDKSLSNMALISVVPRSSGVIDLVVGSWYDRRCASGFSKENLKELINVLTEVHDAMEDI